MKSPFHIYISHHPFQAYKARELAKHLKQLQFEHTIEVAFLDGFLAGSNIENQVYENIQSAGLILVLVSVDYLFERKDELSEIEKSPCRRNNRVVPVPIESCSWKDTFLRELKPLPYDSDFEPSPFDNRSFWYEVFKGVKKILNGEKITRIREITIQRVRADSKVSEHSSNPNLETYEPFILRLRQGEIEFEVEGDSMYPIHQNGAILIGRPVNRHEIKIGTQQAYIINSKVQDPVLKFIKSIDNEKIILASHSPHHPDFEILVEDVISIFVPVPPDIRRTK